MTAIPRLLFIDSGLGGVTVLKAARDMMPEAEIRYLADDAAFPYGTMEPTQLTARVGFLISDVLSKARIDCVVLACNTATVLALSALRGRFSIPFVGTVPAIKPAAALTRTGIIAVLATAATVSRDYTHALIAEHGGANRFVLVSSQMLAAMAEAFAKGEHIDDDAIRAQIGPCFVEISGKRTDVVVLGCTHYPLLLTKLEALAPWPVTWLDPAPAIARRIANVLAAQGYVIGAGTTRTMARIEFTSRQIPSPALSVFLETNGLVPEKLASSIFTA